MMDFLIKPKIPNQSKSLSFSIIPNIKIRIKYTAIFNDNDFEFHDVIFEFRKFGDSSSYFRISHRLDTWI